MWCAIPKYHDQQHYYGKLCIVVQERSMAWLLFTLKKPTLVTFDYGVLKLRVVFASLSYVT
jgi:hypothetical protein